MPRGRWAEREEADDEEDTAAAVSAALGGTEASLLGATFSVGTLMTVVRRMKDVEGCAGVRRLVKASKTISHSMMVYSVDGGRNRWKKETKWKVQIVTMEQPALLEAVEQNPTIRLTPRHGARAATRRSRHRRKIDVHSYFMPVQYIILFNQRFTFDCRGR